MSDLKQIKKQIISIRKEMEPLEEQISNLENEIDCLIDDVRDYAKFKIGQKVYVYADPCNENNPHWCECTIKELYTDDFKFSYKVYISNVASRYTCCEFPEDRFKEHFPWKEPLHRYEEFIKRLANGTSCKEYVSLITEYKDFLIYHHKTHSDWVGDQNETCKAYLAYIKFDPDFENVQWGTLFFQRKRRSYIRKSKKSIEYIKTLIDDKLSTEGNK